MESEIWGPKLWFVIESSAIFIQNDRQNLEKFSEFIHTLPFIIPCSECSDDMKEYLSQHPVPITDKEDTIQWVTDFHNHVREKTNKPKFSKNEILQHYIFEQKNSGILLGFLLIFILFIIFSSLRD